MSLIGIRYVLTPFFEYMDTCGAVHPEEEMRAWSNLNHGARTSQEYVVHQMRSMGCNPSALPLPLREPKEEEHTSCALCRCTRHDS